MLLAFRAFLRIDLETFRNRRHGRGLPFGKLFAFSNFFPRELLLRSTLGLLLRPPVYTFEAASDTDALWNVPKVGKSSKKVQPKRWTILWMLKKRQNHFDSTMWKFQGFFATQILREINLDILHRSSNMAFNFKYSRISILDNFILENTQIS